MASPAVNPWGYDYIITSTRYDGKPRTLYKVLASQCGHYVYTPAHLMDRKYCSLECRNNRPSSSASGACAFCSKEIIRSPSKLKSKTGLIFCGRSCKEQAQSIESGILPISHYKSGETSYRERAFRVHGARCSVCGYSELEAMLDVDHIDSDRSNNRIGNLQVLCVWHHAYKTRVLDKMGA